MTIPPVKIAVFGGIPSHFQTHANIIWLSYGWLHSYIALDQIPLIPISGGLRFEQTDAAPALNRNIWHPPCQSFDNMWTIWTMRKVQLSPATETNVNLCVRVHKTVCYLLFWFYDFVCTVCVRRAYACTCVYIITSMIIYAYIYN